jgi:NDP-sugar pyrophosphorylase family protein
MMPPAVIIAGGVATRLRPLTEKIPKSLIEIAGAPFLDHQLRLLRKNGITKIVICSGYLGEQLEEFAGDGRAYGLSIQFSCDGGRPLGTGGAVRKALPLLEGDFFVVYGDSYPTVDFRDVYAHFQEQSGALGLMTVFKNHDAFDRSNIVFKDGRIIVYDKKNKPADMNYIDYGLGILTRKVFEAAAKQEVFDLVPLYQQMIADRQMAAYEVFERFYEIGSLSGMADTEKYIREHQGG